MAKIDAGKLTASDKLPSERELCSIYGISRSTVRQAMQELQRAGYVSAEHGKGNYIVDPIINQSLMTIYSFSEEMKKLNKVPSTKLISFERVPCNAKVAAQMQLERDTPVLKLERVRLADDEPIMFVTTYLPFSRFAALERSRLEKESLYNMMVRDFGVTLTRMEERMQVVTARKIEAQYLKVPVNHPSMMICRKSYEGEKVLEYALAIARGDRFTYQVVLKNKPEGDQ